MLSAFLIYSTEDNDFVVYSFVLLLGPLHPKLQFLLSIARKIGE